MEKERRGIGIRAALEEVEVSRASFRDDKRGFSSDQWDEDVSSLPEYALVARRNQVAVSSSDLSDACSKHIKVSQHKWTALARKSSKATSSPSPNVS